MRLHNTKNLIMSRAMAELTVPLQTQCHNPTPVAAPRRKRSKSALQTSYSEDASHGRSSQENTKPERPSVPPRPNFSELKKVITRTHSSTVHSATPSNARQRQTSIGGSENHNNKSPGSPRRLAGASSSALMRPSKREELQRIRSKSNSESIDSRHSNGTLKLQQQALSSKVSDSTLQSRSSNRPTHSASLTSEHKKDTNATTSQSGHVWAQNSKQSPTRPKPPLPANRPSIAPTSGAGKGATVSQNRRPSRPPTLPKTAAILNSSKTAPYSRLYGSTQSLPPTDVAKGKEVVTTPKHFDDSSTKVIRSGRLKASPSKEPQHSYRTLPKNYGRKSTTESHRPQLKKRTSDTPQMNGKRVPPASTNVYVRVGTTKLSGSDGQSKSTTLPRKTQPQHSKIPPKRPPPAVRDKPRPIVVSKIPHVHVAPAVDPEETVTTTCSNARNTTNTNQQIFFEDHIYMEVGQTGHPTNTTSWPEGGSGEFEGSATEYPYVIMNRNDSIHIYTPLALDMTDEAEDYDIVQLSDLQESPTAIVTEYPEPDKGDNSMKYSISGKETHQDDEGVSTTTAMPLQPPQIESQTLNNECLQNDNSQPLAEEEDGLPSQHSITEEENQLATADQQTEEETCSHSDQELDIELTCDNQSVPQLECQDSQQLVKKLESDLEGYQATKESSTEMAQEVEQATAGEDSQSDQELKGTTDQEVAKLNEENSQIGVEEHSAQSDGYQESTTLLEMNGESVEETKTDHEEECEQPRSNKPLNDAVVNEPDKQPEDTCIEDNDTRQVMSPSTPTPVCDSPVDQELPDYYNVDAMLTWTT